MSEGKMVIALLAGLAAGAALGILFAPGAGPETRDKLSGSLTNLGESIKATASEQIDNLAKVFKDKVIAAFKEKSDGWPYEVYADDLEHA